MNTKLPHIKKIAIAAASALLPFIIVHTSTAAVIQANFGPSVVDDTDNSPYHTTQGGAFTDTVWNQVNGTTTYNNPPTFPDTNVPGLGSVLYSDGTAATGVSIVMGGSTNSLTADFGLDSVPNTSRTIANGQSAIYQLTTMESGVWNGANTAGQINLVAARVDGLAAGTYEVYVWGNFGNMNNNNFNDGKAAKLFYAEAGSTAATFDITSLESMTGDDPVNAPGAQSVGTWTAGTNYAVATVTLGAGESLYIIGSDAVMGGADDQFRGVLSGMQIVVPEPTTYALFFGIAGLGIVAFRRYKKA